MRVGDTVRLAAGTAELADWLNLRGTVITEEVALQEMDPHVSANVERGATQRLNRTWIRPHTDRPDEHGTKPFNWITADLEVVYGDPPPTDNPQALEAWLKEA